MSQLNIMDNLSTEFTDKYFTFLNEKIFSAIKFLESKGEFHLIEKIKKQLLPAYSNQSKYLYTVDNDIKIISIERLGDMHNGGKCTLLIETNNGKLIYKPLSVDLLCLLNSFLTIYNSSGLFDFYLLKILTNSNELSIIEYIKDQECSELNKFSFHYGALIAILTLLRGIDFHKENIFCINSTPVIVDCESLFYPILKNTKSYDVEATSMLPTKFNRQSLMSFYKLLKDEMANGVKASCKIIKENKNEIRDLILQGNTKRKRIILKPTKFYYKVLRDSLHPMLLVDVNKRKKYIVDCLEGEHEISKAISSSECYDLMNFDVPYFTYYENLLFNSKLNKVEQNFCIDSMKDIFLNLENIDGFHRKILKRLENNE